MLEGYKWDPLRYYLGTWFTWYIQFWLFWKEIEFFLGILRASWIWKINDDRIKVKITKKALIFLKKQIHLFVSCALRTPNILMWSRTQNFRKYFKLPCYKTITILQLLPRFLQLFVTNFSQDFFKKQKWVGRGLGISKNHEESFSRP